MPANAIFTDRYPYIKIVNVPINRTFSVNEYTAAYSGSTPVQSGYKATRLSGTTEGDVLMCCPNGWIRNFTATSSKIISVNWLWLMEPI